MASLVLRRVSSSGPRTWPTQPRRSGCNSRMAAAEFACHLCVFRVSAVFLQVAKRRPPVRSENTAETRNTQRDHQFALVVAADRGRFYSLQVSDGGRRSQIARGYSRPVPPTARICSRSFSQPSFLATC